MPTRSGGRSLPDSRNERTILVYGAGRQQVPVLRACRRNGWRTLAIDRNPDAPGFAIADERHVASLREHAAIQSWTDSKGIDAVLARITDRDALLSAQSIAAERGLPGPCSELVDVATSKRALGRHCERFGIRTPARLDAKATLEWPTKGVIVRPDVSIEGKAGIHRVRDQSRLRERIDLARAHSANGQVDLSTWMDGIDVSVLARLDGGEVRIFAVWDEWVAVDPEGRIRGVGVAMPASIDWSGGSLERFVGAIGRSFPASSSMVVISLRIDATGEPWLVEIHLGPGGDGIADQLIPAACPGTDVFDQFVRAQLGESLVPATRVIRPAALLKSKDGWYLVTAETAEALRAKCRGTLPGDWERPIALGEKDS